MYNQFTGTKYNYPSNDELVELFEKHGYRAAVARELGVSRGCLRSYIANRPSLARRVESVTRGGGHEALQTHGYPDDETLEAMLREHGSVAAIAGKLGIPQPNLHSYVNKRSHLREVLEKHSHRMLPRSPEEIARDGRIYTPEQLDRARAATRAWGKRNSRHRTQQHRLRTYGLTPEDYDRMYENQNGGCAICGRERKLIVDHCHDTGTVRGLLCNHCNVALGWLGDSAESLRVALNYLLTAERR